jgi:hypothetical protein
VIRILSVLLFLSACVTSSPTPFQPADIHNDGYRIIDEGGVLAAVFIGNEKTSVENAKLYSVAAAFAYCDSKNLFALPSLPVLLNQKPNYIHVATGFRCIGQTRVVDGPDILTDNLRIISVDKLNKGFFPGDKILSIGTVLVNSKDDYYKAIDALAVGKIKIRILRNDKPRDIVTTVHDETGLLKANSELLRSQLCANQIVQKLPMCNVVRPLLRVPLPGHTPARRGA